MLAVNILQWWYIEGWRIFASKIFGKIKDIADFFSIGSLVKTLFAPYRQIAAGSVDGALDERFSAAIDKLVSRIVGAVTRIFIILAGLIVMLLMVIFGIIGIIIWPVLPLLPIICIILTAAGAIL